MLDTSLGEIFPNAPPDKAAITILQLLTHRSGLPDSLGADETLIRRDLFLRKALAAPLVHPPDERATYSNTGFSLLAAALEMRSGMRFEDYLRSRVLTPAGTGAIGYVRSGPTSRPLACGFMEGLAWGSTCDYFGRLEPSWFLVGNGGLIASADQLDRWFDAVLGGRVLRRESVELLERALTHEDPAGRRRMSISGANRIFSSEYRRWPDREIVMILLTSTAEWPKERVLPALEAALEPFLAARPASVEKKDVP